jgi:hypothetical protein
MALAMVMEMVPALAQAPGLALAPGRERAPAQVPASAKASRQVTARSGRIPRCHNLPSRGHSLPEIPLRAKFLERESD